MSKHRFASILSERMRGAIVNDHHLYDVPHIPYSCTGACASARAPMCKYVIVVFTSNTSDWQSHCAR